MVIRAYLFLIERTCACLCLPVLACACVCLRVLARACVCLRVHAFCVDCAGMVTVREGRNCSLWWLPRAVSSAWYAFAARPLPPVTVLRFSVASKCCWLLPKVGWAGRAGRVACCQLFVPTAAAAEAVAAAFSKLQLSPKTVPQDPTQNTPNKDPMMTRDGLTTPQDDLRWPQDNPRQPKKASRRPKTTPIRP